MSEDWTELIRLKSLRKYFTQFEAYPDKQVKKRAQKWLKAIQYIIDVEQPRIKNTKRQPIPVELSKMIEHLSWWYADPDTFYEKYFQVDIESELFFSSLKPFLSKEEIDSIRDDIY